MFIIEKYLFRSYELLFFVKDCTEGFDFDGFFFYGEIHKKYLAMPNLRSMKKRPH